MKLTIIPNSKDQILSLINEADAFIIGIENLSVNLPFYFNLNEVIEIINILNENNKEIFIALNKNIHNNDLDLLKETLKILDNYDITGILYYDISVVNIKSELNLKNDLVWSQEHLTTNYNTCNYWFNKGVKYTYLSSEITLEEIITISNNTNMKLLVPIFGYLPMFDSKRHLVKNYLEFFNLNDNSKINYMSKENKTYPIIDDNSGTTVYSGYILNGLKESLNLKNIDYLVLNSFNIDSNIFKDVVHKFKNVSEENVDEYVEDIDSKLNTDRGFLYNETIYRVKKNEK